MTIPACPFCGGAPVVTMPRRPGPAQLHHICGNSWEVRIWAETWEALVDAWSRRAVDPAGVERAMRCTISGAADGEMRIGESNRREVTEDIIRAYLGVEP